MFRVIAIALPTLLGIWGSPAWAEAPCWQVRLYVALYGEKQVVKWAKNHGLSAAEIEEARSRCLPPAR